MKFGVNLWFEKSENIKESLEEAQAKVIDSFYKKISEELKESITNSVINRGTPEVNEEDNCFTIEYVYDLSRFIDELKEDQDKNIRYV